MFCDEMKQISAKLTSIALMRWLQAKRQTEIYYKHTFNKRVTVSKVETFQWNYPNVDLITDLACRTWHTLFRLKSIPNKSKLSINLSKMSTTITMTNELNGTAENA